MDGGMGKKMDGGMGKKMDGGMGKKMDGGMGKKMDGGWGWIVVAATFVTLICTRSITRCVSIFFVEFQMQFSTDYSTTAWINSLLDCITMLCAPLGSLVGKHLSTRVAVMTGGLLSSLGLVLSFFAPSLQFLYGSMGILTGLGFALSYTPAVAIVGAYFNEKKALAYGIAMSGRGIGVFILPPLIQHLIDQYSWRGALLVLGGIISNLCVCGALMRPGLEQSQGEMEKLKLSLDEPDVQEESATFKPAENEWNTEEEEGGKSRDSCEDSSVKEWKVKEEEEDEERIEEPVITCNATEGTSYSNHTRSIIANALFAKLQIADVHLIHEGKESDQKWSVIKNPHLSDLEVQNDSKLAESKRHENTDSKSDDSTLSHLNLANLIPVAPLPREASPEGPPAFPRPKRLRCSASTNKYDFLLNPDFLLLSLSLLFLAFGCSLPFVYLVPYSLSVDLSHHRAVLLMSILGILGIVGNITFGWISDRKCLRTLRVVTFLVPLAFGGLVCLFVPLLTSFPTLVCFSVFYGFCDGAFMALIPVVTCDIVGSAHLPLAMGVVSFLHAIPYLISPPIAGWLLDQSGSYTSLFLLSGLSLLSSSSILSVLALLRHYCRGRCVSLCRSQQV